MAAKIVSAAEATKTRARVKIRPISGRMSGMRFPKGCAAMIDGNEFINLLESNLQKKGFGPISQFVREKILDDIDEVNAETAVSDLLDKEKR